MKKPSIGCALAMVAFFTLHAPVYAEMPPIAAAQEFILPMTTVDVSGSIRYGNVDNDAEGTITAADALLTLQAATDKVTLSDAQQTAADVDGIAGVSANDALLILQKATQKINKFPVEHTSSLTKQQLKTTALSDFQYWLYTPENASGNMPLIIYLHGGSGKGSDLDMLMTDGFPHYLQTGQFGQIPAYVVIPQLPSRYKGWADVKESIYDLLRYMERIYTIDMDKISLTGHSMGGKGTYDIALAYPDQFSRIAPMSGSIENSELNVQTLSHMRVWAFVGTNDTIVSPNSSIAFIDSLKTVNPYANITLLDGAGHFDVPAWGYLDKQFGLIQWLLA